MATGTFGNLTYHWTPATGPNPVGGWAIIIPYMNEMLNPFGSTVFRTELNKRISIAGLAVPGFETPTPQALSDFGQRFQEFPAWITYMRSTYNLPKPVLYGQCRGGLGALNLLCDYPELFGARIACLNPGSNLMSYPGSNAATWAAFGMTQAQFESDATQNQFSPNRKVPGARALRGSKEIHFWCGDADATIPYEQNEKIFAELSGAGVTLVRGMDHVNYLNKEIIDWICGDRMSFDDVFFEAHLTANLSCQANVWKQVFVDSDMQNPVPIFIHRDRAGNYNPATGRFTAKERGLYRTNVALAISSGASIAVGIFKNGAPNTTPECMSNACSMNWPIQMEAGDYLEIRAQSPVDATIISAPFVTGWAVSK